MPTAVFWRPRAFRAWTSTRQSLPPRVQSDEEDVESRLERLEREHALVRFVGRAGSARSLAHAALPVRASHVPERVLRLAARDAEGGAQPRDRRAAGAALRRADRPPGGHRRAVRSRARRRARGGVLEPRRTGGRAALCARRIGAARPARAGAARERASEPGALGGRARAAHDLRPGHEDEPRVRGSRSRHAPTSARASSAARWTIRRA